MIKKKNPRNSDGGRTTNETTNKQGNTAIRQQPINKVSI